MKTNPIPGIITLAAGLIYCILAICMHVSLFPFTKGLLGVLILFYVIGEVVKLVIDINFQPEDSSEDGAEIATITEEQSGQEGSEESEEEGSVEEQGEQ